MSYNNRRHGDKLPIVSAWSTEPPKEHAKKFPTSCARTRCLQIILKFLVVITNATAACENIIL